MKKIILSLIMSFSFFGLSGQTNDFKSVDVEEFAKIIKGRKVTVLDVRLPQEYDEGYIPGTDFNIDVLEDNFKEVALAKLPKRKPVALYCRSGNRSKRAASILAGKGYQVIELSTGYNGWVQASKEGF